MKIPFSAARQGAGDDGDASRRPITPESLTTDRTREVLRRLELDVTRRLDGLLHGDHRGLVPGHGTELGETRAYAPGDDVRRIDWNVTARLDQAYIRQTIAERELETWLLVDRSARLDVGSITSEKRELALAAAASIGFLTSRDGNRLGALLAGRDDLKLIPAKGTRRHLLRILHDIASTPRDDGDGVTDLSAALHRLGSIARRRGMIVVISDFRVQPGWESQIRVAARRHDVLAIEIVDPLELELPNVGLLPVIDPATGEMREIPTQKAAVRKAYAAAAAERRDHLAATFRAAKVDHVVLRTDHDWMSDIVQFLGARKHRLVPLAGART